jgi:hypothetical protein
VVNATFNNVSVISRQSVLLVEETGVPGEKHRSVTERYRNNPTKKQIKMAIIDAQPVLLASFDCISGN